MRAKLTDSFLGNLAPPAKGMQITWDTELKGLGAGVTKNRQRSFGLN